MIDKIRINFSSLAPRLAEQVNLPPGTLSAYQADADAINRLYVRGVIPDSVRQTAHKKLHLNIEIEYRKYLERQKSNANIIDP